MSALRWLAVARALLWWLRDSERRHRIRAAGGWVDSRRTRSGTIIIRRPPKPLWMRVLRRPDDFEKFERRVLEWATGGEPKMGWRQRRRYKRLLRRTAEAARAAREEQERREAEYLARVEAKQREWEGALGGLFADGKYLGEVVSIDARVEVERVDIPRP